MTKHLKRTRNNLYHSRCIFI